MGLTWGEAEMDTLDRIDCRQKVETSGSEQDFIFQMHFKIISQISSLNLNKNFKDQFISQENKHFSINILLSFFLSLK